MNDIVMALREMSLKNGHKFLLMIFALVFFSGEAFGYDCTTHTYDDISFDQTQSTFFPEDKIFIKITCKRLPPGIYKSRVNWVRHNHGVIRYNDQQFELKLQSDRGFYFWMKLDKEGSFTRLVNNSDYDEKLLGKWCVEAFLNDDALTTKCFDVQERRFN